MHSFFRYVWCKRGTGYRIELEFRHFPPSNRILLPATHFTCVNLYLQDHGEVKLVIIVHISRRSYPISRNITLIKQYLKCKCPVIYLAVSSLRGLGRIRQARPSSQFLIYIVPFETSGTHCITIVSREITRARCLPRPSQFFVSRVSSCHGRLCEEDAVVVSGRGGRLFQGS